ncbi:alpha/beta hydrolase [Amycolatopsis rhabdoformis]|uniref:Alpha/beta hydrolase n=1 Tax=Amycolatopsis rhabdoformis TaxID=1448059 RepID=A0ABZ1IFC8_9PSEU|nr:alpha/beta hydrolase [Amycolatopsis rhabdoformis]WSE32456.1 alpha/beta hydrolase [Amycolatopsis rhabdoformis]
MPKNRFVEVNGLSLHITEQGSGPLVILLHGFPDSGYTWRHQLGPIADAGYHVVAPDQRGAGKSRGPEAVDQYSIFHLAGDVVGLIHALGEEEAVIVGHDWGAVVAWHTALLRPDVIRGVAALSVLPPRRTSEPPMTVSEKKFGPGFYQNYFQKPGVAEAEFERDVEKTMRVFFADRSPEVPLESLVPVVAPGEGLLDALNAMPGLPSWLSEEDLAVMVATFEETGFTSFLNWYRNLDRNWEQLAAWHDAKITPPSFFVTATRDLIPAAAGPGFIERLPEVLSDLRGVLNLEGGGHWMQLERPAEVRDALLGFLAEL